MSLSQLKAMAALSGGKLLECRVSAKAPTTAALLGHGEEGGTGWSPGATGLITLPTRDAAKAFVKDCSTGSEAWKTETEWAAEHADYLERATWRPPAKPAQPASINLRSILNSLPKRTVPFPRLR